MAFNIAPGRLKRQALAEMHTKFRTSWLHAEPGFEVLASLFRESPELFSTGEVIWQTRNKMVRKVTLPANDGTTMVTLALKNYRCVKPLRYIFRHSKTALEAANYRVFAELGFPMVKLLFSGDERWNFHLKNSFLATEFAEGYVDGRDFLPGGKLRGTPEQKEFIERNLALVGKLHALHCFHKGARVFNFLWRKGDNGALDIRWIDVASCRFLTVPNFVFRKYLLHDLGDFFRDLQLEDAELRIVLAGYRQNNPRCGMTLEELFTAVKAAAARPR